MKKEIKFVCEDYGLLGALAEISKITGSYVDKIKLRKEIYNSKKATNIILKILEILELYEIRRKKE